MLSLPFKHFLLCFFVPSGVCSFRRFPSRLFFRFPGFLPFPVPPFAHLFPWSLIPVLATKRDHLILPFILSDFHDFLTFFVSVFRSIWPVSPLFNPFLFVLVRY